MTFKLTNPKRLTKPVKVKRPRQPKRTRYYIKSVCTECGITVAPGETFCKSHQNQE